MAKGYVIYNPLAGNGTAEEDAELLQMVYSLPSTITFAFLAAKWNNSP